MTGLLGSYGNSNSLWPAAISGVVFAGLYSTLYGPAADACTPVLGSSWAFWEILRTVIVLASLCAPPTGLVQFQFAAALLNISALALPLLCFVFGLA
jgi:hypothetical protein